MNYETFKQRVMNKKLGHILNPRVFKVRELIFPRESVLVLPIISDVPVIPNTQDMILRGNAPVYVYNELTINNGKGKYINANLNVSKIFSQSRREDPETHILKSIDKINSLNSSKLAVINTGILNAVHRYSTNPEMDWSKWWNVMSTAAFSATRVEDKNIFIRIDLPSKIMTFSESERYKKLSEKNLIKKISLEELNVLMFIKALEGIENLLSENGLFKSPDNINVIFTYMGKGTLWNLKDLLSVSKETNVDGFKGKPGNTAAKLFLSMLHVLTDTPSLSMKKLEQDEGEAGDEVDVKQAEKILQDAEVVEEEVIIPKGDENDPLLEAVNKGDMTVNTYNIIKEIDKKISKREKVKLEDLQVSDKDKSTPDVLGIVDKNLNKNTMGALTEKYVKEVFEKQVEDTIYSMKNAGIYVKNVEKEIKSTALGTDAYYRIEYVDTKGRKGTLPLIVPQLETDGTFKVSGNKYRLINQRSDKPIRKINSKRVALSSNYGKVFVDKARTTRLDLGIWLSKEIKKRTETHDVKLITYGASPVIDVKLPRLYELLSRGIRSFVLDGIYFSFVYENRVSMLKGAKVKTPDKALADIEKKGYVVVGYNGARVYLLNMEDELVELYNGKMVKVNNILDRLDINILNGPLEYPLTRLMRKDIPTVLFLCYYIGLSELLKRLKVSYQTIQDKKDILPDEFGIPFSDGILTFKKENTTAGNILFGLTKVVSQTAGISIKDMDKVDTVKRLLNGIDCKHIHISEIDLMGKMFLDEDTKLLLVDMKEPTNLPDLLIRASELLLTDYQKHPNNMDDMHIKMQNRIPGLLYKSIVSAVKMSNRTGNKITMSPYTLLEAFNADSATVMVEDLNPIADLFQRHDVTYLGTGGRSIDTMSKPTREMHKSDIGIVSEGTRDDSTAGVSASLSYNPNLNSLLGTKGKDEKNIPGIFSISTMLFPFVTTDSPKRMNFISIQNKHNIPFDSSCVLPVRTGAEISIVNNVSKKFALNAKKPGVVKYVSSSKIEVTYEDGTKGSYPLKSWTSKEDSTGTYRHELKSLLKKGDAFEPGDNIYYDTGFFGKDIFNPKGVAMKLGTVGTVGFIEDEESHEDSTGISKKFSDRISIHKEKVRSFTLSAKEAAILNVSIGDKVSADTPLLTMGGTAENTNLDKETLKLLIELSSVSPKAKYTGTIKEIKLFYNSELADMSKQMKKIATLTDGLLDDGNGRVTSAYSVKGKKLEEGECQLKIYIQTDANVLLGDKLVIGAQLKATAGDVFTTDITTEDNRNIDAIFSMRAVEARNVDSLKLMGSLTTVLVAATEKVVDEYFS